MSELSSLYHLEGSDFRGAGHEAPTWHGLALRWKLDVCLCEYLTYLLIGNCYSTKYKIAKIQP